LLHFSKNTL